jgi:hypothetical protein
MDYTGSSSAPLSVPVPELSFSGNLRGGDSSMFYFGTYTETGNQAINDAESHRHTSGMPSVLGRDDAHLSLRGTVQGNGAQLTGTAREAPGVNLQVALSLIRP